MNDGPKISSPMNDRGPGPSAEDLCIYVAELCSELRALTRRPRFRTLNYLLDMARLEAERMAKDLRAGEADASMGRRR